jgi:hypothetical protein
MILEYYKPGSKYTWEQLDKLTGKKEGLWTFPSLAMIQLKNMGFDVVSIEDFDYVRFSTEGETYLIERLGEMVGTAQIEHGDIQYEKKNAELFLETFDFTPRVPDLNDIAKLLEDGYLIICNVNCSHFVVIYRINKSFIYIHDPGLPPRPSLKIAHDKFEKWWGFPSVREKNVMAFRYRR